MIDPLVVYIVINESLAMSAGKIAAQVGHAVQHLCVGALLPTATCLRPHPQANNLMDWVRSDHRKVILKATAKEWGRLKDLNPATVVIDDGHTEVPPGSETVLAFWPMRKSERPPLLRRLRVL